MDDCILSSLSLPPGAKLGSSPRLSDSGSSEPKDDAPVNGGGPKRSSRRGPEGPRQGQADAGDSEDWRLLLGGRSVPRDGTQPRDETIDLTTSGETTDTESVAEDGGESARTGRSLRKRKLSEGVDIPAKQPTEASAFL